MSKISDKDLFIKKFGLHIVNQRMKKNISGAELARLCDMDSPSINRIEKGNVNTSIFIMKKICDALELSFEEFFKNFEK